MSDLHTALRSVLSEIKLAPRRSPSTPPLGITIPIRLYECQKCGGAFTSQEAQVAFNSMPIEELYRKYKVPQGECSCQRYRMQAFQALVAQSIVCPGCMQYVAKPRNERLCYLCVSQPHTRKRWW